MKLTNNALEQMIMEELSLLTEMKKLSDITFPIPKDALKDNNGRKKYLGASSAFDRKKWKNASEEGEIDKAKFVEIIKSFRTDQQNQMKTHKQAKTWAALLDADTAAAFIGGDTSTDTATEPDTTTKPDTTTEPDTTTDTTPSRATYEWKGVEFKFKDEKFNGKPLSKENFKDVFDSRYQTLQVTKRAGTKISEPWRFMYENIIDPAYLDNLLAKIKELKANGIKPFAPTPNNLDDITEKAPAVFNKDRLLALIQAVMDKAKETDQAAVKTAKDALIAYSNQFKQDARDAVKADSTLLAKIQDANNAKAKFDFKDFDQLITNLNNATDATGISTSHRDLTDYYTTHKADITKDPDKQQTYNDAINAVEAKLQAIKNSAFQKKIADATGLANASGATQSSLQTTLDNLKTDFNNDTGFKNYATNNQADYDAAITALENAIDLIVNAWKSPDEAIGIEKPADIIKTSSTTHTDAGRDKILKALRASFGTLINQADLNRIAGLFEGRKRILKEDPDVLELSDIEKYIDDLLSVDPKSLNTTQKTQHDSDLDLADRIDQSLKTYINKIRDPQRAARLRKAKRAYDGLLVKQRGLTPTKFTKYASTDRMPTATTIGGNVKTPVDPVIVDSFVTFFKGQATIVDKINFLKEFSNAVAAAAAGSPAALNAIDADKVIVGGNIINMLSKATRQIDSSAGGLIVEALLAFMVSGEKIGQAGGAADFKGPNGELYSSKWGQSSKGQSKANFSNVGEVITYVSAHKHQTDQAPTGSTGDPLLSHTIYIDKVDITVHDTLTTKANSELFKGPYGAFSSNIKTSYNNAQRTAVSGLTDVVKAGNDTSKKSASTGAYTHFNVSKDDVPNLTKYEIQFVVGETEVFDEIFSKAIETQSNNLVKAVTRLNSLSRSLEEEATSYTVTGDFSDAVALANSHKSIRDQIETIYLEKEGPSSSAKISDIGLTESKMQTLDNLIAEAMRDIKRKTKK